MLMCSMIYTLAAQEGSACRDLKVDNIMLTADHSGIRLSDFGLGTFEEVASSAVGTKEWQGDLCPGHHQQQYPAEHAALSLIYLLS